MTVMAGPGRRSRDAGETLVELLVSTMILALAVVALLLGVLQATAASAFDRGHVDAQVYLTRWADALTAATYVPCATTSALPAASALGVPGTASVSPAYVDVRYWVTPTTTSPGSWATTCGTDSGVQSVRLRVRVTPPNGAPTYDRFLWVTLRRGCNLAASC